MKFICQLLAALLLWLFIACNNQTGKSATAESRKTNTADKMFVQPEAESAPAPAAVQEENISLQKVNKEGVSDDGVVAAPDKKEEEKPYNTEDYDNIVENRFQAATQNPLST